VPVERWTDMAARGWFSGENHIHANYGYGAWYNTPQTILEQIEGEDLNVANLVVANSDGNGVFDREFFRGKLDPLSTPRHLLWWNEEFRSTLWGHMTLFHLPQVIEPVFTGFKDTTNPWDIPTNGDIAQRTRAVGGAVSYTHPTSNRDDPYNAAYGAKGLPVDIATGQIDAMDVMGWIYESSIPLWYRVLNCGFRVPAAAGTDVFLNRIPNSPPGWGRVYVHLPEGLTYDGWVRGVKAGRSFVSNGPVLEFDVNGKSMGEVLALDGSGKVRIKGRARAQHPLEKLELIVNGVVAATGTISADKMDATLETEVAIERSGWVALRASGPAANGWMGANWGMGAHTNPVWVEVKDRPMDSRVEAEYFLGWIDRLEAEVKKRDRLPAGGADHVGRHFLIAREIYRRIAAGTYNFQR
jgi:TolB protein